MSKIKAAQSFWRWFMCNEKNYLNFNDVKEDERETLLEELFTELQKYSKDLGFALNFAPGPRPELIITARGKADLFEDVMFLTHQAPVTDNWSFVNFIAQTEIPDGFAYQDVILYPDDIYFTARRNSRRLGLLDLCLYIRGYNATMESTEFINTITLLLLHLVGETNFGACIGTFSVQNMPVSPAKKRLHKLRELPEFVSTRNVIKRLIPAMESQGIIF